MRTERSLALIQASFGGLLGGVGLLHGGIFFMPVALALLWSASRSPLAAFVWGGIAILISHRWLLALHPLDWIGVPGALSLPVALAIWIFCGVLAGFIVEIWAGFGRWISSLTCREGQIRNQFLYALLMASLWGITEVLLSRLPLFWIGVGGSLLPGDRLLAGIARWVGAGGLSVIQLLIGWWLWQIAVAFRSGERLRKSILIGLLSLFIAHCIGWSLLLPEGEQSSISVALWQPSIPTRTKFSEEEKSLLPSAIEASFRQAKDLGAAWLVAPEGTLMPSHKLVSPSPMTFISGGFRWVKGRQRSSLMVFEKGESSPSSILDKYRLVPLGEWVPSLPGLPIQGLSAVGGLEPGEHQRFLKWSGPTLAGAICYEISDGISLADAVRNGSEWILSIANLDPYPISLHRQFAALAQLRSIETSRELIAVSNTGPSLHVSAEGKTLPVLPPFERGIGVAELDFHRKITGYTRWGETPLICLFIFSIFGLTLFKFP